MPRLKLAQLTDLHLRDALPGCPMRFHRRGREAFELVPEALDLARANGAELIVVTGDVVDVPHAILAANDLPSVPTERWLEAAERDYRRFRKMLDDCGLPYVVTFGNHDHPAVFRRVFGDQPRWQDLPQGYRWVCFADEEAEKHIPRRLGQERELMDQMLADASSPPQLHLQHYVIWPELRANWPFNYLESASLAERLASSGRVTLSVSGHYHEGTELERLRNTYFSTAPAFCVSPYRIALYELRDTEVERQLLPVRARPVTAGRQVVFVDRDGVLNLPASYRRGPEALGLIPGSGRAVAQLRQNGIAVVVVSNQSAIGAGYVTRHTVNAVNDKLCELMVQEAGAWATPDAILYSESAGDEAVHPSWVDDTEAKPNPTLPERAIEVLDLDRRGAWFVGDRETDLQTALAIGAKPVLVRSGFGESTRKRMDGREAQYPGLMYLDNLIQVAEERLKLLAPGD